MKKNKTLIEKRHELFGCLIGIAIAVYTAIIMYIKIETEYIFSAVYLIPFAIVWLLFSEWTYYDFMTDEKKIKGWLDNKLFGLLIGIFCTGGSVLAGLGILLIAKLLIVFVDSEYVIPTLIISGIIAVYLFANYMWGKKIIRDNKKEAKKKK